jgi:PIN domain nuclease of toxin-antitoxin system
VIVADTHALVWLINDDRRLGRQARRTIDRAFARSALAVSAVSFWEMAMLIGKRRLELAQPVPAVRDKLLQNGLEEIAADGAIAIAAGQLSSFHGDPADRFVVATASLAGATLLTADQRILDWESPLRRQDARL